MTEQPQQPSSWWSRLSRTTRLVIVIDLVVLVVVLAGAAIYFAGFRTDSASEASSPSASTTQAGSPLRTPRGLAYIAAACGGAMTLQELPSSPLPRAEDYAVCLAPASGAAIAIGVYDDRAALDDDLADKRIRHRYATRVDDTGKHWLVLVEGESAAPLTPLQRYGFRPQ